MELIDTHAHLDSPDFAADRAEIIARAKAAGVTKIISIGAGQGIDSAKNAIALAEEYDFIWATAGIHPHDTNSPVDINSLTKLAKHPRVVAIGETGLDFYRDWAPRDKQEAWFKAQIALALEVKKPLIIHSRAAAKECLDLLSSEGGAGSWRGISLLR